MPAPAPCSSPTPHPAILRAEFIYGGEAYPQCHASTLAETSSGELVAAWFGGTAESNPDVRIWSSRWDRGAWTPGIAVADGGLPSGGRHATWNPVLFQPRNGPLMLFYKVGPSCETWRSLLQVSADGGRSWQPPSPLPPDALGPIKNKPLQLSDGTLLCGSSREYPDGRWEVRLERSPDLGRTWQVGPPLDSSEQFNAIQPAFLTHTGSRLQILCRTKEMVLATSWSDDVGRSWSPLTATSLRNPNSGIDVVTLADGRQLLVHNPRSDGSGVPRNPKHLALGGAQPHAAGADDDWGVRWPLAVSLSRDGRDWRMALTLESEPCLHGYAYPAAIQTRDSLVHISYTWNRERIKHVVLDPGKLTPAA